MKKVLVLGCGPAGLLVAHAAMTQGHGVAIASKKEPSFIAGAQFLHTFIPGVTEPRPDGVVRFVKHGSETGYAGKVYGDPFAPTSWATYPEGEREVWNLRSVYERLWRLLENNIQNIKITPALLPVLLTEYDAVFSTVPAKVLFPEGKFDSRDVWIRQVHDTVPEMTLHYNGYPSAPWYRASNIFGNESLEFAQDPSGEVVKISKPTHASFENPYPHLHLFGRYGKWQKGVLVDDAYRDAVEVSNALHNM